MLGCQLHTCLAEPRVAWVHVPRTHLGHRQQHPGWGPDRARRKGNPWNALQHRAQQKASVHCAAQALGACRGHMFDRAALALGQRTLCVLPKHSHGQAEEGVGH